MLGGALIDFFVEDKCVVCGRSEERRLPIPDAITSAVSRSVRVRAFGLVPVTNHPLCSRCLLTLRSCGPARPLAGRNGPIPLTAAFYANTTLLTIIHRVKFSRYDSLLGPLGDALARASKGIVTPASILIPVPMDRRSLRARGFNPAQRLAEIVAASTGANCHSDAIVKPRRVPAQSSLARSARASNARRAFAASSLARVRFTGADVVVVDDLVTTGSTAIACATIAHACGARRVSVACVGWTP